MKKLNWADFVSTRTLVLFVSADWEKALLNFRVGRTYDCLYFPTHYSAFLWTELLCPIPFLLLNLPCNAAILINRTTVLLNTSEITKTIIRHSVQCIITNHYTCMATEPSTFYRELKTIINPYIIVHFMIITKNYHTKRKI